MGSQTYPCVSVLMPSDGDVVVPSRQTFLIVWLKALPLVLLAFSTVTFNTMVLWMFKVKKSLRSCKNIYLGSLAMADLIIGVSMFPAAVQQLKGQVEWLPFVWCRVYLVVRQSALYVSLLSLLLITADRWWSIHYPFSYRTRRRKKNAFLAVGGVWLIGFSLQTIPVAVWDFLIPKETPSLNSSSPDLDLVLKTFPACELPFSHNISFVAIVSGIQYFVPLVAMLTLNCSLYLGILGRKKIQIRRSLNSSDKKSSLRPSKDGDELAKSLLVKQDRRAACWLGLLVIVFLVCWLPHMIVGVLITTRHNGVPLWARDVTFWFLLANSAINPLLYGFFNKEIREAFKQWMYGGSMRRARGKNALFIYGI
ncbi:unnamed protein product, partial [Lymnaea stagnalis]